MDKLDVFVSRPNWVPAHIEKQFVTFYTLLNEFDFIPRTIGINEVPMAAPFDHVVRLMNQCSCTIVLGFPQLRVEQGKIKGKQIQEPFSLPTEWNQIEAAISIMLKKPTLMMIHNGVAARGLFERGAANVFVHEFHTLGPKWLQELVPKLTALRNSVNA